MKSILKTIIILIVGTIIVDYIFVVSTHKKPFIVIDTVRDGENIKYESILYDMYNCDGKVEIKFKNSYYVCPNITGEMTLFLNIEETCNPLEPFYQEYYYTCPKCKHKYVISYEDDEIRENIKRIKELDREAASVTDNNEIVNLMKKRNNLKNRNLEKSNQYMVVFKGV